MQEEKVKTYQSYLLHCWSEQSATPGDSPIRHFIVEEVLGHQRWEFNTFEQVMNFLLDELLGQPEEVPENSG